MRTHRKAEQRCGVQLKELKEKFFGACGDKENVEKMLGEVQSLVTKLASDEEAQQELMQDGSKVWEKIEGNDEVLDSHHSAPDLFSLLWMSSQSAEHTTMQLEH